MRKTLIAASVLLFSCGSSGLERTAEWHRANNCMTSETYKLLDKGYSAADAKVGATLNCSKEIDAVKGDGYAKSR